MPNLTSDTLLSEYESIIAKTGAGSDDKIIAALVKEAAWTKRGARELLRLARRYGTSILPNALALAVAMRIEDGSSGM